MTEPHVPEEAMLETPEAIVALRHASPKSDPRFAAACAAGPRRWLIVAALCLPLVGCGSPPRSAATPQQLQLIPWPQRVETGAGTFSLPRKLTIAVASNDSADRFAAELLRSEFEANGTVAARVIRGGRGNVVLTRSGAPPGSGDQGYRLRVAANGVRISAATSRGIFYGVQTLRQMIRPSGIPEAVIEDWPALPWRGVQDDISRGPVPTLESLKRRIATLAEYKINLFVLYIERQYDYRSEPLLPPPGGALTEAEVRELVGFAERHHVTLVPQQQTFGHTHAILGFEKYRELGEIPYGDLLTPENPRTYQLIKSLYDELAALFPGPFLHIGGDEPRELGSGQSRRVVEQAGPLGVYLTHLIRVRTLLAPHQRRLMFWADVVVKNPELVRDFPPDMIPMSWNYDRADSLERWLRPFRQPKREFFVCPGASNWNRVFPDLAVAIPNIRGFTRAGQQAGAIGQLNCTWDDNADALFGLCWYPLLYGAAAAWQSGECDSARFRAAFDWAFFRKEGDEIAQAIDGIALAHRLVRAVGTPFAGIGLTWLNPFESHDRQALGDLVPIAFELRRAQENALQLLASSRPRVRRNADQLDYLVFAARRLHYIGFKAIEVVRARDLYLDGLAASAKGDTYHALLCMDPLTQSLGEGAYYCSELLTDFERLWLAENRPHALEAMRARFRRDQGMWLEQGDEFRRAIEEASRGARLPPPERFGLTAVRTRAIDKTKL
jgi:hexosaminidase